VSGCFPKKRRRERGKLNRGAKIQQTGGNDHDEASPVPIDIIYKINGLDIQLKGLMTRFVTEVT
jgi:hypothetical protein